MSEERANSALGLISMITTFSAWAVLMTLFIIMGYLEATRPGSLDWIDEQSPIFGMIGFVFLGAMIFNFAGLIAGIVALCSQNQRKLFGILGVIAGLSLLALGALVIILGLMAG